MLFTFSPPAGCRASRAGAPSSEIQEAAQTTATFHKIWHGMKSTFVHHSLARSLLKDGDLWKRVWFFSCSFFYVTARSNAELVTHWSKIDTKVIDSLFCLWRDDFLTNDIINKTCFDLCPSIWKANQFAHSIYHLFGLHSLEYPIKSNWKYFTLKKQT